MKPGSESVGDGEAIGGKPVIAITMGDPAGIGPEIVSKAIADPEVLENAIPLVVGAQGAFREFGSIPAFENAADAIASGRPALLDIGDTGLDFSPGCLSVECGRLAGKSIEAAVDLCQKGIAGAMATAPINKQSFAMGGYEFPGHTEFLAHLTSTSNFRMSFFAGDLRVVLLTTHLPLVEAIRAITVANLVRLIVFTNDALGALLGRRVTIAVAGLNPHASEGGMFGDEEQRIFEPAIRESAAGGVLVTGPYSPDTIFLRGFKGEFDAVIACYHDQATIAVKGISFGKGVNVTLGLPIIRTSVDHGTAFEIAGKGIADASSMKEAILVASRLARVKSEKART